MNVVDLRSDTVTKPTAGMLEAMFKAKIGDDVFGEDEAINELEQKTAAIFGMEAGLFCPSGTMSNQIAIKCFTQPLDELITDQTAHIYRYEGGGIAFNSAVSTRLLDGYRGILTAEMIEPEINADHVYYPRTSLVVLENSSNRGGGSCYTLKQIKPIAKLCKEKGLKLHLDGARIFNALAYTGDKAHDYGKYFDGISVCFSKGLGAPVGSVFLANAETIKYARRVRKVLGGGMRQGGFLAAAASYALDHHVERLKIDHAHAQILARALSECLLVTNVLPVETNIILFDTVVPAANLVEKLEQQGIKALATATNRIRFVLHLDIHPEQVEYVVKVLNEFEL
jgi:threonine aldolase